MMDKDGLGLKSVEVEILSAWYKPQLFHAVDVGFFFKKKCSDFKETFA